MYFLLLHHMRPLCVCSRLQIECARCFHGGYIKHITSMSAVGYVSLILERGSSLRAVAFIFRGINIDT